MPKARAAKPEPTTAQRLSSIIKSVRDIMRKDKGLNGDADRLPMLTWMMFLKFLDDLEALQEAAPQRGVAGGVMHVVGGHLAECAVELAAVGVLQRDHHEVGARCRGQEFGDQERSPWPGGLVSMLTATHQEPCPVPPAQAGERGDRAPLVAVGWGVQP